DNFLLIDRADGLRQRVRGGELFVEERRPQNEPPHGLIHHYEGAVFIPGVTVSQVLSVVQNYDQHKRYYAPEVMDSKTLSREGNEFLVRLRLLKKKIVTVVLETEHKVRYKQVDPKKWESVSRSVKVSEVEHPGSDREEQNPQGMGNGFVWRLDSFWRFLESDGGVFVECTSVSLSRDIPFGMENQLIEVELIANGPVHIPTLAEREGGATPYSVEIRRIKRIHSSDSL
ncbi:MAG: hypothetical protein HUU36_10420, partial [Candidatus Omnitrophica bacterium]|nr:hypothetical protein [Candidatus Omnitrophota bacterium]